MSGQSWVVVTQEKQTRGMVLAARALSEPVVALVVGPQSLADLTATTGVDEVRWVPAEADQPPEAFAPALAQVVAASAPRVVLAGAEPGGRAVLGAVAAALSATVLPAVVAMSDDGGQLVVLQAALGGEVLRTLVPAGALAGVFAGADPQDGGAGGSAPVVQLAVESVDLRIARDEAGAAATGVADAARVVSFGRGVRAKADIALLGELAQALDAELACSMPVADDLGWLAKDRYVGRSGQHIAPRLYLAVGIGGAPQHMEGVRDAKVVAAVNSDPDARIFREADFGVVGDLYEVVPALIAAVRSAAPVTSVVKQ